MTRYFRLELNIGSEDPLPLSRHTVARPDLIQEADPRVKYPVSAEEKSKIEQAQNLLQAWFPI
jgi:hypothetical protein